MFEIYLQSSNENLEKIAHCLQLLGAVAISYLDAKDNPIYEPNPDEVIFWDQTTLTALFEDDSLKEGVCRYLNERQTEGLIYSFNCKVVPEKNWERECLDQFAPMSFGKRLWIVPSWHEAPHPEAVNILLDPGLAFGTGTHPTTRLCLEWLDEHIKGGETVIDYGCGSGILAISALKLGAQKAYAIDHEQQALLATQMNAKQNHIPEENIATFLPNECRCDPADILLANILAKPILGLTKHFASLIKNNGIIVLSGIFGEQVEEVLAAYETYFKLDPPAALDRWIRITGIKKEIPSIK